MHMAVEHHPWTTPQKETNYPSFRMQQLRVAGQLEVESHESLPLSDLTLCSS